MPTHWVGGEEVGSLVGYPYQLGEINLTRREWDTCPAAHGGRSGGAGDKVATVHDCSMLPTGRPLPCQRWQRSYWDGMGELNLWPFSRAPAPN